MDDERLLIEFETPRRVDEVFPWRADRPEQRRCSDCGSNSQPLPLNQLTVIKHRMAGQPLGHMRLYCNEHILRVTREWTHGPEGRYARYGEACPTCFQTMPLTGGCDQCG